MALTWLQCVVIIKETKNKKEKCNRRNNLFLLMRYVLFTIQ